jgi:hypothetical protein
MTARPNPPAVRDVQLQTRQVRDLVASRRRLAEAAHEGWRWNTHTDAGVYAHLRVLAPDHIIYSRHVADCSGRGENDRAEEYAAFIADNDPAHVLALLALVDQMLDVVALHSLECDCASCALADTVISHYLLEEASRART